MLERFLASDELSLATAEAIGTALSDAIASRGTASLVATGGRSPGPVYDRLSLADVDWPRITVTLSDDRCVGEDHADSNTRLVRTRLLQGPAAAARFLPLWPAPEAAALQLLMPFDVVMLGMGEDGHIASLIPGDPGLEDGLTTDEFLRDVPAGLGNPPLARITLTLTAILNSRATFLLIAGETKREVIARAMAGEDLPVARLITQAGDRLRIFWTPGA
jgi:6-phosphogluconolactonase